MQILDDLISTMDFDAPVRDIRQGVFHTGVVTRHCGLASTLPRDALSQSPPLVREPGFLTDKNARELTQLAYSESILEAAVGMATLNSLLDVDESVIAELNAADLILEKGGDKKVAIVGHFPFVPRVREKVGKLWVIEKNPKEGDLPETEADRVLPRADVVAITGAAFTNRSLEGLLRLCDPTAFVILLGDTTPLSPVLFDYGVDALAGTRVTDTDLALRCVSQGANFRQIKGTKRVTMTKPGI
jgi:uncharacterized protein (DUF4213/DUF364 family)